MAQLRPAGAASSVKPLLPAVPPVSHRAKEPAKQRRPRRTSQKVDVLRARALLDDDLAEVTDADREWVWRSLLKGIRLDEAWVLALLDSDRLDEALEAVRARYEQRTRAYNERRAKERAAIELRAGSGDDHG